MLRNLHSASRVIPSYIVTHLLHSPLSKAIKPTKNGLNDHKRGDEVGVDLEFSGIRGCGIPDILVLLPELISVGTHW